MVHIPHVGHCRRLVVTTISTLARTAELISRYSSVSDHIAVIWLLTQSAWNPTMTPGEVINQGNFHWLRSAVILELSGWQ